MNLEAELMTFILLSWHLTAGRTHLRRLVWISWSARLEIRRKISFFQGSLECKDEVERLRAIFKTLRDELKHSHHHHHPHCPCNAHERHDHSVKPDWMTGAGEHADAHVVDDRFPGAKK